MLDEPARLLVSVDQCPAYDDIVVACPLKEAEQV